MKAAKRKKDEARRLELITKLGEKDHPVIYKEATKWVKDKNYKLAAAAVVTIARQKTSAKKAGPFLHKLLGREKRTDVVCAAIVGLGGWGQTLVKSGFQGLAIVRQYESVVFERHWLRQYAEESP